MPYKAITYTLTPYPYKIPSPPKLSPETIKKLDRRDVLRFLHIEALLRSQIVWDLYQQATRRTIRRKTAPPARNVELWTFLYGKNRLSLRGERDAPMRRLLWDESLRDRFNVEDGWAVLLGSHHRYLHPQKPSFRIGEGMVDLSLLHRTPDLSFKLKYLEEEQSRYLYLMIDSAEVSSSDLTALKHLLRERQKAESPETRFQKAPPIKDARAWLNYLRCYDIRHCEGVSYGEVGKRVYEAPEGRSEKAGKKRRSIYRQVKRDCKHVKELIRYAEKGPWLLPRL